MVEVSGWSYNEFNQFNMIVESHHGKMIMLLCYKMLSYKISFTLNINLIILLSEQFAYIYIMVYM